MKKLSGYGLIDPTVCAATVSNGILFDKTLKQRVHVYFTGARQIGVQSNTIYLHNLLCNSDILFA